MEDFTHAVFVVIPLFSFDLVVGLLCGSWLYLLGGTGNLGVAVHAASHSVLVLPLGNLVHVSRTLGGVEVGCRKGQDHTVNGQEFNAGALLGIVVPHFEILGAAKWKLGQQLLLLIAKLFDLLSDLPVHVVAFALGTLCFLVVDLANNFGAHRAVWRE